MNFSPSVVFRAEIVENLRVTAEIFKLSLRPLEQFSKPSAGQFFMLQIGEANDPLLRRPFSIYDLLEDRLVFLYRIRGRGTALLSEKKSGQIISVAGPFGRSYPEPEGREVLVVAGGLGIASVNYLIKNLLNIGGPCNSKGYSVRLLLGARTAQEIILPSDIRPLLSQIMIATDDGSEGIKGTVVDLLQGVNLTERPVIYACGPKAVLMAVDSIAIREGLSAYLSVEERMACGMGACLGCVVMTGDGYKRVCKEGPIFRQGELLW